MVWGLALLAALIVLGPVLGPGQLFNLDLIATDRIPVPSGVWGLGPALPRRLPFVLPLAWAATVIPGTALIKGLMGAAIVGAILGAHRFATGLSPTIRVGVALLYGLSPFLLTRISIGHIGIYLAAAVLPWVVGPLLQPGVSLKRTFLACLALGLTGITGGMLAGLAVGAGLWVERGRRLPLVAGAWFAGQLVWLAPAVAVATQGFNPNAGEGFATRIPGVGGILRLSVGHGFWQVPFQVGAGTTIEATIAAIALGTLAVMGYRSVLQSRGRGLALAAAAALTIVVASALPGVSSAYRVLAGTLLGAPLREGHRLLPLWLLWFFLAAGHGAERIRAMGENRAALRSLTAAVPLAAALLLAAPAFWGFGGTLQPVQLPSEWAEARQIRDAQPGPILALPWAQYMNLSAAGARRVLNPVPQYFGGDVLISSNPKAGEDSQERAEPREGSARRLAARAQAGQPISEDLARLGVRWIVLLHSADWTSYEAGLRADPGLRQVVAGETLELLEVTDWEGPGVAEASGEPVGVDSVLRPVGRADDPVAFTWFRPAASGWLRGLTAAGANDDGNLAVPGGGGMIWYWPAIPVVLLQVAAIGAGFVAVVRVRRSRTAADDDG